MLTLTSGMARRLPPKSATKGRQEHPHGPLDTVDDDWKEDVRAAMAERDWDQKKLAEKISISEGAISGMFRPGPRQIRYKARIHEALQWPDPTRADGAVRRILRAVPNLDPVDAESLAVLAESLAKKRRAAGP